MIRLGHSAVFDLALICAGLILGSTVLLSAVFYAGTVGVLTRQVDSKIENLGRRLGDEADCTSPGLFAARVGQALNDGVDSDTEIYLFVDRAGHRLAGNIAPWAGGSGPFDRVIDRTVLRDGRRASARVVVHALSDGGLLVVGRDKQDLNEIGNLVATAIISGGLLTLAFAAIGTLLFRRQLELRIGAIRQATREIEAGDLTRRIPLSGKPDEFNRLSADINHMLDRIETLMEGVRHLSNTIAHNLRTPLARIRGHLEDIQRGRRPETASGAPEGFAIEEIDLLTSTLEKLLQIAEAESGTRRQPFGPVALREIVTNLTELYDAAAESEGVTLLTELEGEPSVRGDRDLLACIIANLLDNALKYAGAGSVVRLQARQTGSGQVRLVVEDNGPGIPRQERSKVLHRFYRLDHTQQGNGLGLSIVAAFTALHEGTLRLEDAGPGLRVRIELPAA